MPPDPLHSPGVRRANKKNDEDLEVRRARGEISCAECRRLKLRCDKKIPCSSCTQCDLYFSEEGHNFHLPQWLLDDGPRFAAADTAQLQTRIGEMAQRIRQLEDALAVFQSAVSTEVHPLLREELLAIKYGTKPNEPERPSVSEHAIPVDPVIDSLGSMSIGDRGEGKYFGRSAGAEMLMMAGAEPDFLEASEPKEELPDDVTALEWNFPFPQRGTEVSEIDWDICFKYLPEEPRAWSLCETFIEHATWKFRPIGRDQLVEELLTPIYRAQKEHRVTGVYPSENLAAHKFATLYYVFAIGALMDLTSEALNEEAHLYYNMGSGCLNMRSMFDSQDIITVQAVLLLGQYKGLGGRRYTMDSTWYLTALAVKLAEGLGLHRDPAHFRMDAKTGERRRNLFWEIISTDHYNSLSLGRPPSVRLSDTDCRFPEDDEATVDEQGNTLVGYYRWKYQFIRDVFAVVTEATLTAETPSYQRILELDRRLREFTIPPHLNTFTSPREDGFTPMQYMKRCLLGQYRSSTLLYLHRSFCVKAMLDHAKNPLQSPYAPSFLAAYRCASGVVRMVADHYERYPELCQRWWSIWTSLFNAAVVLGAIVCRSPTSSIAPTAFLELGLGSELFEKGAAKGVLQSEKARSALAILQTLRSKALRAYSSVRSGPGLAETVIPLGNEEIDHGFDELALFGGQTRILVCEWLQIKPKRPRRELISGESPSSSASEGTGSSGSLEPAVPTPPDDFRDVHPSLVEYISSYAAFEPTINNFDFGQPSTHGQPFDSSTWTPASIIPLMDQSGDKSNTSMQSGLQTSTGMVFREDPQQLTSYVSPSMSGQSGTGMNTSWNAFLEASGLIQPTNNGNGAIETTNDSTPAPPSSFDFTDLQGFY